MLSGCLSVTGTGKLNAAEYREVLDENWLQSAHKLRLWWQFDLQHDYDQKHTTTTRLEWLWNKPLIVPQRPSQSPDLNPIEHLWRDLKLAVHRRFSSSLVELVRI